MFGLRLRSSLCELQPGRKNKHRLNAILQFRTSLIKCIDSDILDRILQMEDGQSPFMPPSCLETHATPNHENGDRAPFNPPSTRQHSLTPATAPGLPAVPCSEYTHAHETNEEKRENKTKALREMEKTKTRRKGPEINERRRFPSGSSE